MTTFPDKLRLISSAMADPDLSASAKCVLAVLLLKFHHTESGRCFPAYDTLAAACGRKRRAIISAAQELAEKGWMRIEVTSTGGRGNTNRFSFTFPATANDAPERVRSTAPFDAERVQPATLFYEERVQSTAPFVPERVRPTTHFRAERVQYSAERVQSTAPEPSYNLPALWAGEGRDISPLPPTAPDGAGGGKGFAEFWRHYPKKSGQKAARREFAKALASGEATVAEIVTGAIHYAEARREEDPRFTKDPSNWLRGGHWADVYPDAGEESRRGSKQNFSFVDEAMKAGGWR